MNETQLFCDSYLAHHGVKGMKWGVRRYQNKDGSLTPVGKKRASKEYKKYSVKGMEDLAKSYGSRYAKAYNKAADDMNNGLIEKYNSDYEKKLGSKAKDHDYDNDNEYMKGYEKLFNERFDKHYLKETYNEMINNTNLKKAQAICDKYGMLEFDDLAKQNAEALEYARSNSG